MQKLGRSKRDKLERQLLALATERTNYLNRIDAEMLEVQGRLEERETYPHSDHGIDLRDMGHESIDDIPVEFMAGPMAYADAHPVSMGADASDSATSERAARTARLMVALLAMVARDQRSPRLTAAASLLALGAPDCPSMRDVAKAEHVSPEWVSQRTEAIRKQFDLPTNQHNKPAFARAKYSEHRLRNPVVRGERKST